MYTQERYGSYEVGFGGGTPPAVKNLIIANIIVFLIQTINPFYGDIIITYFGLTPSDITGRFFVWQLISYMFLHGNFMHILLNMFFLWMFGAEIERHWGSKEFYKYYFIAGAGAGLFNVFFQPFSPIPIVGASGAIYGILAAFGLMFPERLIYFYFLIPIKTKYFVLVMGAVAFLSAFSTQTSNIAHFAHLGGMVAGYLYLKFNWRINKLFNQVKNQFSYTHLKMHKSSRAGTSDNMRERIDEILDKINDVGYESLSEEERYILQKASDFLNKKK